MGAATRVAEDEGDGCVIDWEKRDMGRERERGGEGEGGRGRG